MFAGFHLSPCLTEGWSFRACCVIGGGAPNAPCARSNFHHCGWGGGGAGNNNIFV